MGDRPEKAAPEGPQEGPERSQERGSMPPCSEEMVRLLSHDLRNPLTAVQLNAQLLERAAAQQGRHKEQRLAGHIASAVRHLDEMLRQMVEAERLRSGRIPLAFEEVDLAAWLPGLLAKPDVGLDPGRVHLAGSGPCPLVRADPKWLGQAVLGLVRLALQEADEQAGVGLALRAAASEVSCTVCAPATPGAHAASSVLPAGTAARTGPSQGITLYFARAILEAHGGGLQVAAPAGGGLELTGSLPTPGSP